MILNIDKHEVGSIAVIDSAGNELSYGGLVEFSEELVKVIPVRSVVFLLAGNDTGGNSMEYRSYQ